MTTIGFDRSMLGRGAAPGFVEISKGRFMAADLARKQGMKAVKPVSKRLASRALEATSAGDQLLNLHRIRTRSTPIPPAPAMAYRDPGGMRHEELATEVARRRAWIKAVENGSGGLTQRDQAEYARQKTRLSTVQRYSPW